MKSLLYLFVRRFAENVYLVRLRWYYLFARDGLSCLFIDRLDKDLAIPFFYDEPCECDKIEFDDYVRCGVYILPNLILPERFLSYDGLLSWLNKRFCSIYCCY